MTLLGWVASVSLTVSMGLIVWAALALLNLHPPTHGLVKWNGRKAHNHKEEK